MLGRRAGGEPRRNQVREVGFQVFDEGVRVDRLEQIGGAIPDIPGFNGRVLGELAFDSQVIGVYPVRPEVGRHGSLRKRPRIENAGREEGIQRIAHAGAMEIYRRGLAVGFGARESLQEDLRGGRRHVDVDVIERRIVR